MTTQVESGANPPKETAPAASPQTSGPWRVLAIMIGALALGSLLNARQLAVTAAAQPAGWQRDVAMMTTDGLVDIGDALGFDLPHQWADEALGRIEADTPDGTLTPRSTFVPTPEQPAQLLIAGDSLMDTVGPAVVNRAAETGVIETRLEVQYSSGLTRPEMFNWPSRLERDLALAPTDIVVFMVGANDGQPIQNSQGWASFGTPEWSDEYTARVGTTMDLISRHVAVIYWVGQPIPREEVQAQRVSVMNALYRFAAGGRSDVRYIDSWELFADAEGGYAAYLPDSSGNPVQMRDPDGVHLTPTGADVLAEAILDAIEDDWQL